MNTKSFFFAMLALMLCSSKVIAKVVTENQAAMVAERFIHVQGKKLTRKHQIKAGTSDQSPYYIFTGSDGKGFVIIAADDVARPVLGYSTDAELTPDGELPIPMEQWLTSIGNQIRQAQENGIQQSADVAEQWRASSMGNTVVKLQTAEWGQVYPFNNQCPYDGDARSLTGCVPTAYAILMRYYKYPLSGRGMTQAYVSELDSTVISVPSRDLEHPYDWDNMPLDFDSDEYTSTQADNVAELMADIGAAIQVDYSSYATGGYEGCGDLYSHFDYHPGSARVKDFYSSSEWDEMMRRELDKGHPIIYKAKSTAGGGHCFLLDGYTDDDYFSVNWGWTGNYNGFFALDALTPGSRFYASNHVAYLNTAPIPSCDADFVVAVNGEPYPTLTGAIRNYSAGQTAMTIDLLADIEDESLVILEGKTITLNLGNHSIDMLSSFFNYGNFTVNGTEESRITTHGNHSVLSNYNVMNVNGGSYINACAAVDSTDYRRVVWSAERSNTHISDVSFTVPGEVICVQGDMTIESGTFTCTGNDAVINNYSTTGTLNILGGKFVNEGTVSGGSDYRRCLWTRAGSKTHISDGIFKSLKNVICTNGELTIDSGSFATMGNSSVISNYNYTDTLKIHGGTFVNNCTPPSGSDYRRCLWTDEDSKTLITGGLFKSPGQVICTNGAMTIESGSFTTTGNTAVFSNYNTKGTLRIHGGTFTNSCISYGDNDYRRCVWTTAGSITLIKHAAFNNIHGSQTLCFNGDAIINGAEINNENGAYGCLTGSEAKVVVYDCKLSASVPFFANYGSKITCKGGLYSSLVADKFLAEECSCVRNTDAETRQKYPYRVTGYSSPAIIFADAKVKAICIDNWDADIDDELSEAEAAAVESLGSVFENNSEITSFDELAYFTGLTGIDEKAFSHCSNLNSVSIPNTVENIGDSAFYNCHSLTSLIIPENVALIGNQAFGECQLLNVLVKCVTPPETAGETFFSKQSFYHTTLYIPSGSWKLYAFDGNWYQFINIRETATTEEQLSMLQAYTLMDAGTFAYSVYDPVNDRISSVNRYGIDENNPNHCWQVIEVDGECYLYNLGAKKFVTYSGNSLCLTSDATAIEMRNGRDGIVLGEQNGSQWAFVNNDRMNVEDAIADVIWAIQGTSSSLQTDADIYDVDGRKVNKTRKGINIIRYSDGTTRKVMIQ